MNPDLSLLQPYPFEKLNALKVGVQPPAQPHIALSIGEPKHAAPEFVTRRLVETMGGSVRAASVPGKGTTFTLVLPAARPRARG